MDVFRTAANPWDQEVLVGIAWDLMWLAIIASAVFIVGHAIWMATKGGAPPAGDEGTESDAGATGPDAPAGIPERVQRHSLAARAFHWLMALSMFGLLITAFVPVLGLQFEWVQLHWIAGLVLVAAILYHIVHATFFMDFWAMWRAPSDLERGVEELKHSLGAGSGDAPKAGKYPFDHQLFHHMAATMTVVAILTGLVMLVRVDTPFVAQNPYLLGDGTWGIVYVLHGLSGVALIGLIAAHIYFAIRPEKRWITWSMIRGWIDRDHYLAHHDPARWDVTDGSGSTQADSAGD